LQEIFQNYNFHVSIFIHVPPANKPLGIYRNGPVHQSICLSVQMSCKHNFSQTVEMIMMKLYTVDLYNLRIAIKEYNLCPKYIKGGNKKCGTEDILL